MDVLYCSDVFPAGDLDPTLRGELQGDLDPMPRGELQGDRNHIVFCCGDLNHTLKSSVTKLNGHERLCGDVLMCCGDLTLSYLSAYSYLLIFLSIRDNF